MAVAVSGIGSWRAEEGAPISATLVLVNLVGGATLLLWGMRMVRTGFTKAFGSKLRHVIQLGAGDRLTAMLGGMGVTAILQSSTATALMVTSFVSRGLMETAPALAIMLGADIGTTLVAQVLSFDIGWLSPLLIVAGVVTHYFARTTSYRQLGRAVIGLGLMLLSLKLIVAASQPLHESAILRGVFASLTGEYVIAVLIAALLTWLAHSSLAVVLLVMSLAANGIVSVAVAFALVLGANLGGTLPAIVATAVEGPPARRIAFGNAFFKVAGCVAFLPLIEVVVPALAFIEADAARQVVNFHTAFNLAVAAVFIPLTAAVAGIAVRLLPAAPETDDPGRPRHLDRASIDTPAVALSLAARETLRMGDFVEAMLSRSMTALDRDDRKLANQVAAMDNTIDRLHKAITLYVTAVTRESPDEEESRRATEILTFTTNLEHIGDIVENLTEMIAKKIKHQMRFSADGLAEIATLHQKVADNLKLALGVFMSHDVKMARRLLAEKKRVIALERAGAGSHLARLREGRPESIESSALHMDILRDLKRIHSHIVAVAYPVLERAGELPTMAPVEAETAAADADPAGGAAEPAKEVGDTGDQAPVTR